MDILEDLRTTTFSNNEAFFKKAACEIEQLRTENAALKEQITNAKYNYLGAMADCKQYEETITQQAIDITSLKQSEAYWESQYNQISFVLDSTERDKEALEETIELLKEQVAHIKEIEFPTKCIAIADIWKNKVTLLDETIAQQAAELEAAKYNYIGAMADCKQYVAMIEQQAEAIRLKDEALANILGHDQYVMFQRCPDCDYNCAGICKDMPISEYGELAKVGLAIQPYPEILHARDEKVAEACAKTYEQAFYMNKAESIRSGEWRKYL